MFNKLFQHFRNSGNPTDQPELISQSVALTDLVIAKMRSDALASNYKKQVSQFKNSTDEEKSITALHLYLLGEQILLKQEILQQHEILNFRKQLFSEFEVLQRSEPFAIALQELNIQEYSLSGMFLNHVIDRSYEILGSMKNNLLTEAKQLIREHASDSAVQQDLSLLSRDLFNTLENSLGKEKVINLYQGIYYKMTAQYRLLEGFSCLINMMPEGDLNIDQLEVLNKIQIQNLLLEKIETLESTNDRLSHEISERRKIEQELKESESLLNKIIESAMDAMVLLNSSGSIDYWSLQSETLLGWTRSEIIGQLFAQKLLPSDHQATFNQAMEDFVVRRESTAQKKRFETKLLNKAGEQIDVEISMTSVKLKDQYIVSAFIRNISQRKEYEREILEARDKAEEASAAKLTFLSMMSHEIRTPLNAVIGTTQLLLEEDPRKDQLENLNILKFSAENLLSIINDILDFNKAEEGKVVLENKPFNLEVLCNNIVNSFIPKSKEKGIQIKFENKLKRINLVSGDETRLSQVLINLFGNAVKFTSKGSVMLSVELINLNNRQGEVKFEVIDTGIGIPKDKIASIFDRFTQVHEHDSKANYGGTGLGLPIAKNIVKLMGGDLAISSVPGLGSTFYFSIKLPIPFKEGVQTNKSSKEEFAIIHHKKILIVEDHKINQIVATKFLKKYQCEIDIAENGLEAVKIMEESPQYDLILMDLEMPLMNGYEAALAIRELEKDKSQTPIVALSANALLDVSKKVQEAGMNGYISKPFEAKHFYAQIADNIR